MCLLVLSSGSWVAFAPVSVRCVVFCCLSLGASGVFFSSCRPRPEDWLYFPRYALGYILQLARRFLRCFGTLDLSIRSIASVGHMVMCVVKVQMVGARRSPGATMLGSRSCTSSANHHSPVPPTGPVLSDASWWTMYEMAGCLHQTGSFSWVFSGTSVRSTGGVAASSPTRCRGSRIFLPCRCGDSGFVSRTSQQNVTLRCFCIQTLRRHVLRPVATGVSLSAVHIFFLCWRDC